MMNRFEKLSYTDEKSIEILISKLIVIKSKWKDLKITEDEFFVLKFLNILSSSFETYLIILNEKVRKNKNLLNLNILIIRLKQEEHRMQIQKNQINILQRHIEDRNFCEGCDDRDRNRENKNAENKRDDNDINDDKTNDYYHCCYINRRLSTYKYCLDKNIICSNDKCKKRDHQFKNCRQKDDDIHQKDESKKNKFNKSDKTFKTSARHIASVKIFINDLIINHCDSYILNSKTTHHCWGNKALFKNLRAINEVIKTANNEVLNIEAINNIKILLSNGEFLILSETMYILILMINLIITPRLWHKSFDVLYLTDQPWKICLSNDQLITNANMSNNQ